MSLHRVAQCKSFAMYIMMKNYHYYIEGVFGAASRLDVCLTGFL
jgi:hypothetical protein